MKKLGEAIGKFVVKHRILIVIASILLCIPSLFGYINTDINYDNIYYPLYMEYSTYMHYMYYPCAYILALHMQ